MPHEPVVGVSKKVVTQFVDELCDATGFGEPKHREFFELILKRFTSFAIAPALAEYAAALRAAEAVVNARDCMDGTREWKSFTVLRSALAAPHVRALLSGNAGQS